MPGTLLVSLDFELFWGMLDICPLNDYRENVLGGRKAIPELLELFRKYGIHATWASVGFLFADNKQELMGYFPEDGLRPSYRKPDLAPYSYANTTLEADRDCFFAPELLALIAQKPGQEIASHTFSHFYCREPGQTTAQFRTDMQLALQIAQDKGYDLKTVILPRNQSERAYTAVLQELGFAAYRDEENDWIHEKIHFRPLLRALRLLDVYLPLTGQGGYRPMKEDGIWNFTGSRMYKPMLAGLPFLERLKLRRIKKQMCHAAKKGLCFHLWWHPHNLGLNTRQHLQQLEEIFDYYQQLQKDYGMRSLNMQEAAAMAEEGRL